MDLGSGVLTKCFSIAVTETSQRGIFCSLGFQRARSVVIRPPAPEQNTMAVAARAKCDTSWWIGMIQEGGILPGPASSNRLRHRPGSPGLKRSELS